MKSSEFLKIHPLLADRVRLSIMTAVSTSGRPLTFTELIEMLELTRGNLSVHISKLENEKLIVVKKDFVDRKPCTTYVCSDFGRKEMKNYIQVVEQLIKKLKKG